MDSDKDQKVKRIARFLELGGTMLAEHCKVCGAPKFRYQGTVICPICDVREEEEEETPAPEPEAEVQAPEARSSPGRDRPPLETRKKVQVRRQKPRFGQRIPEAEEEEEKSLPYTKEKLSGVPYKTEKTEGMVSEETTVSEEIRTFPEIQAVPVVRERHKEAPGAFAVDRELDSEVLTDLLFKKMVIIAASLQDEKNLRSIAEQLELIEKGIGLIERLRQI